MSTAPSDDDGFAEFGVSFFRMKSGVTHDLIIHSSGDWIGSIVNAADVDDAYFIWQTNTPIYPTQSKTFTFETPVVLISKTGTNHASSFTPVGDITGGNYPYEAGVFQYAIAPGEEVFVSVEAIDDEAIESTSSPDNEGMFRISRESADGYWLATQPLTVDFTLPATLSDEAIRGVDYDLYFKDEYGQLNLFTGNSVTFQPGVTAIDRPLKNLF